MKMDAIIRIRTPEDLKKRIKRIANHKFLQSSDVAREALRNYADAEEQKLREAKGTQAA